MSTLEHRKIKFEKLIAECEDLKIFAPILPSDEWHYYGPVAVTREVTAQHGLIVKALDPASLDDVVDWKPVFIDIEGQAFSTWRGIPRNHNDYAVIGHLFVEGIDKPTPAQTAGIKAVRKDLISERRPQRTVWTKWLPKAVLTLWDILVVDLVHVATGGFVSSGSQSADDASIGVLWFKA